MDMAQIARLARAAGVSYGQYVSTLNRSAPALKPKKANVKHRCTICGTSLDGTTRPHVRKYCEKCATERQREHNRLRMRNVRGGVRGANV